MAKETSLIPELEVGHKQFLVQDPDGYLLGFFEKIGTRSYELTSRSNMSS